MTLTINTMAGPDDDDISRFCHGMVDRARAEDRLKRYLRSGSVRPEWCFVATTPAAHVMARHWWWAAPGSSRPAGVDLVSVEDRVSAVDLLCHARDELRVNTAICDLVAPIRSPDGQAADSHGDWHDVLIASGFLLEVSRVRVEWTAELGVPSVGKRLRFQPARCIDEEDLLRLFESVADGSLDHWMNTDRAQYGREHEARERLTAARTFQPEPDSLTVGCTRDGTPVGYAAPTIVDEVAVIGEIGVAAGYRGNRYGLELLCHATRGLADAGAARIVADTDRDNTPMRNALTQAGFIDREYRANYSWRSELASEQLPC